ncbi:hypothetical protein ACK8HJ_16385 [Vreelandella titanicae]|uniref:Uncharacterized protein n=1 Tax=Vreelandella titanicae BH1 TaxID=1204738 RepID=L9U8Q9_9GAMM|nr:hypothetical protein [Halomonas titanicae]ELY21157.1 hypothetical protein HALTITAN_2036 [Halomonas titanicae BH1]NVE90564.1 hypothetical protein [Halomonas titanicae]
MLTKKSSTETLSLKHFNNSGVIFLDGILGNDLMIELLENTKGQNLDYEKINSLNEKILISKEVQKLLFSHKFINAINLTYSKNLIFVGTKVLTLKNNTKSDWSFHEDLYLKQRAFDEGCTLWLPLTDNLNDSKGKLSASIVPKHYGYCDPLYQHLNFLEKLELPTENIDFNYKRYTNNKLQNLWSETLAGHAMSEILNRSCYKLQSSLSSAFLVDKQALINFEYVSKHNNNTDLTLIGLTFYSEHSVFRHRGLDKEKSNVNFLSNINGYNNDGHPITDLLGFNSDRIIKIKLGSIDIDKIKEKFDPRTCFD